LLGAALATVRGLSLWVLAAMSLTAALTFLGLAMANKIVTGEERLVYYPQQIAVTLTNALLLWLLGQPLLPYLDLTTLGVGTFLAFGKLGCLKVGCCHGRPYRWGVCYRPEHADAGFASHLVGVRLFPTQAVESLWVFGCVVAGSVLVLAGRPPGEAMAAYILLYGVGRFCIDFMRGDAAHAYRWGFVDAQWTSLLLMCGVVGAELVGVLPIQLWHVGLTAGVALTVLAVGLSRRVRRTNRHRLLQPRHVREVAEIIGRVAGPTTGEERGASREMEGAARAAIDVGSTSLGVQISAGRIESAAGPIEHYTLSSQNGAMSEKTARTLADLIVQLGHPLQSSELFSQTRGIFHLLIHPLSVESLQ